MLHKPPIILRNRAEYRLIPGAIIRDGDRKGTGKRGHIVADTLLPTQMFSVCPRAQHLLRTQILCPGHKNVSDFVQKHFVSATN